MKRLTIAVATLALLASCGHSPTAVDSDYIDEPGSLSFRIGPDAEAILGAGPAADVGGLVASAYTEQMNYNIGDEVDGAVALIKSQHPQTVQITQTRLQPVDWSKRGPATVEYPDFAPLLKEALESAGELFLLSDYELVTCCTVPMTVAGQDDTEMELRVTEAILTNVKWRP